jgi:hypothetical protein
MLHTLRFSLQTAVYFIILPFLVHVLFTFHIQCVLNLNVKFKVCKSVYHRTIEMNHQHQVGDLFELYNDARTYKP